MNRVGLFPENRTRNHRDESVVAPCLNKLFEINADYLRLHFHGKAIAPALLCSCPHLEAWRCRDVTEGEVGHAAIA
jgi:hypothetical protein